MVNPASAPNPAFAPDLHLTRAICGVYVTHTAHEGTQVTCPVYAVYGGVPPIPILCTWHTSSVWPPGPAPQQQHDESAGQRALPGDSGCTQAHPQVHRGASRCIGVHKDASRCIRVPQRAWQYSPRDSETHRNVSCTHREARWHMRWHQGDLVGNVCDFHHFLKRFIGWDRHT